MCAVGFVCFGLSWRLFVPGSDGHSADGRGCAGGRAHAGLGFSGGGETLSSVRCGGAEGLCPGSLDPLPHFRAARLPLAGLQSLVGASGSVSPGEGRAGRDPGSSSSPARWAHSLLLGVSPPPSGFSIPRRPEVPSPL